MYPFGSIGKINLIPAIGLASNLSSEIDRKASGCLSCSFYASALKGEKSPDQCATCEKKKTAYQNEKSRYGFKPSLTKAELLVFMSLHLYNPSPTGIVADVSVANNLAVDCHIAQKTAYEALDNLVSKGYICLDTSTRGAYTVLIQDYEKYFVPAKKGGRGYVIFTREIFDQFVSMNGTINALRYAVRSYINIDMDSKNTPEHSLTHSETIRQALSYLPGYLRPCHIRKIVQEYLPDMFKPVKDIVRNIVINLDPAYYGPNIKNNLIEEEIDVFKTQLEEVVESLHSHQKGLVSTLHLSDLAKAAQIGLVHLRADTDNPHLQPESIVKTDGSSLLSLAQISLEYSRDRVIQALKRVWQEWRPGDKDQASYIRTILSTQ